ncbi:hypothetical protein HIM_05253 [Hirsutella minnesotensis 3608]|uniref:Transporter n=1 Tax=Hirsutella minnesotensis 3608 TaxID=1043627 RepID=A0A0F8A0H0_9HYPO|nr:hypothetical protein HIM_05253 [Hirsutella minnesotensis 3608]
MDSGKVFVGSKASRGHERAIDSTAPTETSPLLPPVACPVDEEEDTCKDSIYADIGPLIKTRNDWQREAKVIVASSAPLIITFLLQYSVDALSLIAAGRVGTLELGAVSLANMSAAITCFAPIQGLATSLDTLCAQAYGSGRKHLIGLYCQRMTLFLLCHLVPVSVLWFYSESILVHLVADAESARLGALYLQILICAVPGYIAFETGKRFLQAQGLFRATTYILLLAAPCHVVLLCVLVGRLGFIGAPIAIVLTRTLLPILLIVYVKFVDGSECWPGLTKRVFANWKPMIRLAVPGMVMVEAEYLAFEVMIIASSRFGTEYLAAQSILAAIATISFQVPFSVSIAASTRVASLIGAGLVDTARVAAKVAITTTCITGFLNLIVYLVLRAQLPFIFTDDPTVAALTSRVLPLLSAAALLEGLAATAHGLLRGIGRQSIGGPVTISAYYLVALPTSLAMAFALDWKLQGLISGLIIGLAVVSLIEYAYLNWTDWQKTADEAASRNALG